MVFDAGIKGGSGRIDLSAGFTGHFNNFFMLLTSTIGSNTDINLQRVRQLAPTKMAMVMKTDSDKGICGA